MHASSALAASIALCAAAAPAGAREVRISPAGDSITLGVLTSGSDYTDDTGEVGGETNPNVYLPPSHAPGPGYDTSKNYDVLEGYRYPLYRGLTDAAAGAATYEFVGNAAGRDDGTFSRGHNSSDGRRLSDMASRADESFMGGMPTDYVLLLIGTNDLSLSARTFQQSKDRMVNVLDAFLDLQPSTTVLVSTLLPIGDAGSAVGDRALADPANDWTSTPGDSPLKSTRIDVFNAWLLDNAKAQLASTTGRTAAEVDEAVKVVDIHQAFVDAGHTFTDGNGQQFLPVRGEADADVGLVDGLHPNYAGYDFVAEQWFGALSANGAVPVPEPLAAGGAAGVALLALRRRRAVAA